MSSATPSSTASEIGGLLLETAGASYHLPGTSPTAVIRLHEWSPVPGAPSYVLGTTEHEERIYTILDPDGFEPALQPEKPAPVPSAPQESRIGLVITDERAHPYILVGLRVRSAPASGTNGWTELTFPPPLLMPGTAQTPIQIQRGPNATTRSEPMART